MRGADHMGSFCNLLINPFMISPCLKEFHVGAPVFFHLLPCILWYQVYSCCRSLTEALVTEMCCGCSLLLNSRVGELHFSEVKWCREGFAFRRNMNKCLVQNGAWMIQCSLRRPRSKSKCIIYRPFGRNDQSAWRAVIVSFSISKCNSLFNDQCTTWSHTIIFNNIRHSLFFFFLPLIPWLESSLVMHVINHKLYTSQTEHKWRRLSHVPLALWQQRPQSHRGPLLHVINPRPLKVTEINFNCIDLFIWHPQ